MVEDTHQKSTMATVDFFWRTSPPPSMQPRPMVFGPVLWDKSPTKLLSSKKMGIEQGNVYEIANNFIDHCV